MSRPPQAPLFIREMGLPVRFALYVLLALLIALVDTRYDTLQGLRSALNSVLHPVRLGLAAPWGWAHEVGGFFRTHGRLQAENQRLLQERARLLQQQQQLLALAAENTHLRTLLALPPRPGVAMMAAEIVTVSADPFARRVLIDKGAAHGLVAGRPVVDASGLVGQVTRLYPLTAEVTLLTDRDQSAPVMNLRNGLRVLVSGTGADNLLEVRFLDMHADMKPGDRLYTSGIDGVFPAGIPVAEVIRVEAPRHAPFAKAVCRPLAGVGRHRQVAVLHAAPAHARPEAAGRP